jgi:hypothetical protein
MAELDGPRVTRRLESIEERLRRLERSATVISSTQTLVTFDDAGKPITKLGKTSDSLYDLDVFDNSGNRRVRVGELTSTGRYGLEVYSTGNTVEMRAGRLASSTGYGLEVRRSDGAMVKMANYLTPAAANVDTAQSLSTAGTSWRDLATSGPSVSVTIGPAKRALVWITCGFSTPNGAETSAGFNVVQSGSTTVAASVNRAIITSANSLGSPDALAEQQGSAYLVTSTMGLSSGAATFKMLYRDRFVGGGSFYARNIVVQPF